MPQTESLPPDALYHRCDTARFRFESTAELPELPDLVGQERAVEALEFGLSIARSGYNIFVFGPAGSGKHRLAKQHLDAVAVERPVPGDWCYVNNFAAPHKPNALALPPGRGRALRDDMLKLIEELRVAIPAAFESDEYRARLQALEEALKERQETAFNELQEQARAKGIALIRSPQGLALAPMSEGNVVSPEVFQQWPPAQRQQMEADIGALEKQLQETLEKLPQWAREHWQQLRELSHEVTSFAIAHAMRELRERYADVAEVPAYLDDVEADLIEHAEDFVPDPRQAQGLPMLMGAGAPVRAPSFDRYRVNLVSEHGDATCAPVVYEDLPQFQNLFGRIEHLAQFGALFTDFNLIKGGSLHAANGGYLLLDAQKVLTQPFVWEALKRALHTREIRLQNVTDMIGMPSTVSLEPEPIPLDVKVVLLGEPMLYYLLSQLDPEFPELFKISADFEHTVSRQEDTVDLYVRSLASIARNEGLRALAPDGVGRVIEHASRLAQDAEKLTLRMRNVIDLLTQADAWAERNGRELVTATDVQCAIDAHVRRSDRIRELSFEAIQREIVLIETSGAAVGQVNGLSVLELGDFAFGKPTRITATVRVGRGQVVDIEREVELGGPLHSKGVMILSGYLGERYAKDTPLALTASLVFEQSYGGVDGDSASSTELYAILSALAGLPIRQSLAVTGSVNQHGEVQAIGGVNEKIEGFFEVCRARGLTGEQGVLIPRSNVKHLMLDAGVVDAVRGGKFAIYPIATIDEGIELLTGVSAGAAAADGSYPEGSVNQRVMAELARFAERARAHAERPPGAGHGNGEAPE